MPSTSAETPRSLSIVIPAYNEAENILDTLANVTTALAPRGLAHEILVIDDGSTDGTAARVTSHLATLPNVQVLQNDRNRGFGWSYRRGVETARLGYTVMVHGDNAWGAATLGEFFSRTGDADIIIGYTREMWRSRTWQRTLISKAFTWSVNRVTGRGLRYYNGLQIHQSAVLKRMQIQSSGYGFQAEVLVKGLQATRTFVEVPMDLIERQKGESKAFRWKNVVDTLKTLRVIRGSVRGRDA